MSTPHKPRRKANQRATTPQASEGGKSSRKPGSNSSPSASDFPLVDMLWSAKKSTSQWAILPLVLMGVGLFRWAVGLWGYSGFNTPPMYGDFEAQRHWMEITTHLPVSQWYFYDLDYWGLDYPPLTAYHSWILGKIGSQLNPTWFALDASRGHESQDLKIYMRATALVSEYLIYIPAVVIFNRRFAQLCGVSVWESSIALVAILMQPSTILIDHGHFQYNTVMLGFVIASASSMLAGRLLWGCVFFVAALSFKQMALYYAPAIFAYLLGVCLQPKINIPRFIAIALVTTLSFGVMFGPLLLGAEHDHMKSPKTTSSLKPPYLYELVQSIVPIPIDKNVYLYPAVLHLTQAIHRIFPLARGLFEDKVANVWCTIHTVYKLNHLPTEVLSRLSLLATMTTIFPSCLLLFLSPRKTMLPYALASCAWGFFLCSFQVHEKSVLLPLLPMTLLLGGQGGLTPEIRAWVGWANALGSWTMFPLLKRDGLQVPYRVLQLLWAYFMGLPPTSSSLYLPGQGAISTPTKVLHLGFYLAMFSWDFIEAVVPPPQNKPDLWVVLNCIVGAAGFGVCYLWCTWNLILRSGNMDGDWRKQAIVDLKRENSPETKRMASGGGADTKSEKKKK